MKNIITITCCILLLFSCKSKDAEPPEEATADDVQTPVTVTTIETADLNDYAELNATSTYQQSSIVKAPANGYLTRVNLKIGEQVGKGQIAFSLQTKEARALGNTINKLDPGFRFSGMIDIRATASGYVQNLDHQSGDYVQDGEQLASIADAKSFGFMLSLPVELRRYLSAGRSVKLMLPDGTSLDGIVSNITPIVDSVSQTQNVLINVHSPNTIPQNLIARVRIVKAQRSNAVTLPRQALLTDEAQSNFWVMKMIDSITAIKVPVVKGMETADRVEIIRPVFASTDKILLSGNYGLPDTAKVKIVKAPE